jgi:hypothetical protein
VFLNEVYQSKVWITISIIFFAVNLLIPIDSFLKSFNYVGIDEKDTLDKTFEEMYFQIEHYDRVNPVTMKKAKLKYLDKMFEKDLIKAEEHKRYKIMIENNEPVNIVEIYHDNKHKDKNYLLFPSIKRDRFSKQFNIQKKRKTIFSSYPLMPIGKIYFKIS